MMPPDLSSPPSAIEVDRQIMVVLEEYRQIEAEKRMVAQALLAVTGLLFVAFAAVAGNLKQDNLLPLAVLAPAVLVAGWAGAVLKAYADEYVVYLSVVEEKLQQLSRAPDPLIGWNTMWSTVNGKANELKTQRVASIAPLLGAALGLAVVTMFIGILGMATSPSFDKWPTVIRVLGGVGYVALNVGLGSMVAITWVQRRARLRTSEVAFKVHLGLQQMSLPDNGPPAGE